MTTSEGSDRDTLADVILGAKIDGKTSDETADDILAAGWRPPARETTDPDALPPGSIVLRDGLAWHRDVGYWHLVCGGHARWDRPFGSDPITVVYVPTEEAESRG